MTKKTASRVITLAIATSFALSIVPALAGAALYSDDFTYPNGNLTPNGGWYAHSSAGAKPVQVSGGTVVVQQSAGSAEDINHPIPARAATDVTLASFTLNVPAGTIGTAQDYFAHFRPAGNDSNNFVSRTWIGPPTAGGSYRIGIAAGSLTTTPVTPWVTDLNFGQTYKIWIQYDGNTSTSTLWVDPVTRASTSVSSTFSPTLNGRLLASFALRQASPAGATYSEVVDNVEVDSQTGAAAVPSMSQWGAMILASMLLLTGGFFMVRRRKAVA